jgi:predicted permease
MLVGHWWSEWRYGVRTLKRAPLFACSTILVLALGIAANTAVFSIINGVLLRPLPLSDPERLVSMWSTRTDRDRAPLSILDFEDFRSRSVSLADAAALATWGANLVGGGEPERLQGVRVTANYFQLTGVSAIWGRTLLPDDDSPSAPRVAMISYLLWQRRFGGGPQVLGQVLSLNGDAYTVVGIMPPEFFFPVYDGQVAVPLAPLSDPRRRDRGDHFLVGVGRLKPGVSREGAEAELTSLARKLQSAYPTTNAKSSSVRIVPLLDQVVGATRGSLLGLNVAVMMLMVIACSSIANLLLVRNVARRPEIGLRIALGASRFQIARQFFIESAVLAGCAALLGLGAAREALQMCLRFGGLNLPRLQSVQLDGRAIAFAAAISFTALLIFGVLPAVMIARRPVRQAMAAGGRGSGRGTDTARRIFVIAQLALSVVLLIAAGLLVRSLTTLLQRSPGFEPANALVLRLSLPVPSFRDADAIALYHAEVQRRIEAIPGVERAAAVSILPMSGLMAASDFSVVGRPPASASETPAAQYRAIGPGLVPALGLTLLSGRDISAEDTPSGRKVAMVSATLARRYLTSGAVGTHLRMEDGEMVEVIGVVGDVKHFGLEAESTSDVYVPYAQTPPSALPYMRNNMFWVVRTKIAPMAVANQARSEVRAVNADVAVSSIQPLDAYLAGSLAQRRFTLALVATFAVSALGLAVFGLYSVVAHAVLQRSRELAVRAAIGATPRALVRLVMLEGLGTGSVGLAVGLACALPLMGFARSLLYGVGQFDVVSYGSICAMLGAMTLLAAYIPARRAARIDPLAALRS